MQLKQSGGPLRRRRRHDASRPDAAAGGASKLHEQPNKFTERGGISIDARQGQENGHALGEHGGTINRPRAYFRDPDGTA
jgi:hypothetical protein